MMSGIRTLMLINRDYDNPHAVRVVFEDGDSNGDSALSGQ